MAQQKINIKLKMYVYIHNLKTLNETKPVIVTNDAIGFMQRTFSQRAMNYNLNHSWLRSRLISDTTQKGMSVSEKLF